MVLILDGHSDIGARVRSNLCYLICLGHLVRSRAFTNLFFLLRKDIVFLHACAICSELPSNMSTTMYSQPKQAPDISIERAGLVDL